MSFIRPVPWTRQPQAPVRINYGNSLAQGLVFCAPLSLGDRLRDLVSRQTATATGLSSYAANRNGVYPVFGSSNYADFAAPSGIDNTSQATIAWSQEPRSTTSYSAVLNVKVSGATNSFLIYQSASDSQYYFMVGPRKTGTSISFSASIGAATNNLIDRFVLQCAGGLMSQTASDYVLWRNGVRFTTSTTGSLSPDTTEGLRIGALPGGAGDPFEGLLGDVSIWRRLLTDTEAVAWSGNPWQLLAPVTRRIWVPQSGAAPTFLGAWARGSTTIVGSGMPGG